MIKKTMKVSKEKVSEVAPEPRRVEEDEEDEDEEDEEYEEEEEDEEEEEEEEEEGIEVEQERRMIALREHLARCLLDECRSAWHLTEEELHQVANIYCNEGY